MDSPGPQALQRLCLLNRSSSEFHDQLSNVLYGEEYKQCVPNLQDGHLVWLVDYLDKVCRHTALDSLTLRLGLSCCRLSMVLILPVLLSESVCANSEAYAVPGGYSRHHTRSRLTFSTLALIHSPQEVLAMCTRGPSMT